MFLPSADVFALLVNGLIIIVVVGITTLLTVTLECVPLMFVLFWLLLLPGWLMLLPS